jgi:hypothetical protein
VILLWILLQNADPAEPSLEPALRQEALRQASQSWYDAQSGQLRRVEGPKIRSRPRKEGSLPSLPHLPGFAALLVLGLLVFLLGALIALIVAKRSRSGDGGAGEICGDRPIRLRSHLLPEGLREEGDLLTRAREARSRGDLRAAFRLLFAHALVVLDAHHVLRLHPAKTNRAFLGEVADNPIQPWFTTLVLAFEAHAFGRAAAQPELWDELHQSFPSFSTDEPSQ